jgi:hypothetical protein
MRRLFSKSELREISSVLTFVLLVASFPSTAGFVVVSGTDYPELTINICQPLQMFDRVSNTLLARPATVLPEFALRDLGSTSVNERLQLVDFKVAPETPPPKLAV